MDTDDRTAQRHSRIGSVLMQSLGVILLAIGAVGVFIPLVPTTPLVIAAAFCLASNPRIHGYIMDSPFFGDYIRAWREGRTIPLRTRIMGIAFLWMTLIVTMMFFMTRDWQHLMLITIGVCVTIHLATVFRNHQGSGQSGSVVGTSDSPE